MEPIRFIWIGVMFFAGWIWFYLFGRQLIFNFTAAYPTIKKMRSLDKELIAPGADKYTNVSVIVCIVVIAAVAALIVRFCKLDLLISFFAGAFVALLLYIPSSTITTRNTFDLFCSAYSRFVPDDALRTAMYGRDVKDIKKRLKEMDFADTFVPEFKK